MPNVYITLPNVDESVFRPIVADLAKQIQSFTNLNFVEDIRFLNYNNNIQTPSKGIDNENSRYASFSGQNRIWIEAEEDYNQDGWSSSVIERDEHWPLFFDSKLDVFIAPILVPSNLTLKIKFSTNSRDEARRWRDDITMRLAVLRDGHQHKLTFNLNLPVSIWELLESVWVNREAVKGYGQPLDEYIKEFSDSDLTIVSNSQGHHRTFAFRRILNRVNGHFEASPLPDKPSYDEGSGAWVCNIDYKITYDRPVGCRVRYPIVVHNQFLPDKFISWNVEPPAPTDLPKKLSISMHAFSQFESYAINGYNASQDAFIQIPNIDDFVPVVAPVGTVTVVLALIKLKTEEPQILMNLAELDDSLLDLDILDFIKETEFFFMNKPHESFLGIQVYRGQDLLLSTTVLCDKNLNIISTENFDLRSEYRVRLSLTIDPTLLSQQAFIRLRNYPKALTKIVSAINETLRRDSNFLNISNQRYVHDWQFSKLWTVLNGLSSPSQTSIGRILDTNKTNSFKVTKNPKQQDPYDDVVIVDPSKPRKAKEDELTIPPEAFELLKNTPRMRTVQLQGTLIYNKQR